VSELCILAVVASPLTCVAVLVSFTSPSATEKVKSVLKTLSTQGPKENLEIFTSFPTRRAPLSFPPESPFFANPISDYLSDVNNQSPCNVYASDFSSISRQAGEARNGCCLKSRRYRLRPNLRLLLIENRLQITSEWGSDGLRERISLTEFPHWWGQNSIVGLLSSYP
jgi:hypothetical protein